MRHIAAKIAKMAKREKHLAKSLKKKKKMAARAHGGAFGIENGERSGSEQRRKSWRQQAMAARQRKQAAW